MLENTGSKIKSFWERPEGTLGMIVLVLSVSIPTFVLWGSILPWLVSMLQNTLSAMILTLEIATVAFLVFNRKLRTLLAYMFQSAMRGIASLYTELDPIGIMKNYISDLVFELKNLREQKVNLAGSLESLGNEITTNNTGIEDEKQGALDAREALQHHKLSPDDAEQAILLASRQSDRLQRMNEELMPLRTNMEAFLRVIVHTERQSQFVLEDLKREVTVEERKRKVSKIGSSALRSARAILQGSEAGKELYDQALESTRDHYASVMGEIRMFVEETRGIAAQVNLADAVAVERMNRKINAMLTSMEGRTAANVLPAGREVKQIMAASEDPAQTINTRRLEAIPVSQEPQHRRGEKYRSVFDN